MENIKSKKGRVRAGFYAAIIFTFLMVLLFAIILENRWYSYVAIGAVGAAMLYIRIQFSPKGIKYVSLWVLFLCLLGLSIFFGRSTLSVSLAGDFFNKGVRTINHLYAQSNGSAIFHDTMLKGQREAYDFNSWEVPKGYQNSLIALSKSSAYMLTKDDGNHEKVIYQMHGGGYVGVFHTSYNDRALQYSACYDNADVFSLDYRTAPDNLHPAALEDALEGYQWLLDQGYASDNIILCGDSAGAGLALATTLYLKDHNNPLPKLLILSSPWADLSQEGESYVVNTKKDAFFGLPSVDMKPQYPIPILYAGEHDLHDPYLSPAFGDYTNMPPMLIQAGADEMLLSDSEAIVKKAEQANVDVKFIKYEGMYHAFYIVTPHIHEGKKAWSEIEAFIKSHK